uniref:Regulator of G protein signaling 14 n=1 Tax=Leptobrachium leishanense TaxID=445787 RepID=A0A8C5MY40_9ANUR
MFSEPERKRSLQFLEFPFWEVRGARTRLSTLRSKFKASKSFYINRSLESREVFAVSDGELNNTDGRGSDQSLNSLPSVRSSGLASDHSVASWAVSFERLLQDSLGVEYFTEFLKKEYSAENIFFWKACEKFQNIPADNSEQLLKESRSIYNEFLSSSSVCPVNVDHQAVITEDMLQKPFLDMFKAQQMQIFNLMKFDSYARFVKSSLYQDCMVSEVEGRPLPSLISSPTTTCINFPSGAVKKKLRAGKSLPLAVEVTEVESSTDSGSRPRRSFKRKDRKGTGRELADPNEASSRRESRTSLNSSTSLDHNLISSFSSKFENDNGSHSSTEPDGEAKPLKYCCVYLPDGTASLSAVRPGVSIRDILAGICEKRGYCITDVKVYLTGNEQKPLALDQESKVLADQEVRLETRIGFDLHIEHVNKNVRIVAKPLKSIREALQPTMKKYGLENHHVVLHKVGESKILDQGCSINEVARQKLVLEVPDIKEGKTRTGSVTDHQTKTDHPNNKTEDTSKSTNRNHHGIQKEVDHMNHLLCGKMKSKLPKHTYDFEGLVELLNRVQNSRAEDQRGLLSKKDLELPDFLKLPTENQFENCHTSSVEVSKEVPKTPPPSPGSSPDFEMNSKCRGSKDTPTTLTNECSAAPHNHGSVNESASLTDMAQAKKDSTLQRRFQVLAPCLTRHLSMSKYIMRNRNLHCKKSHSYIYDLPDARQSCRSICTYKILYGKIY